MKFTKWLSLNEMPQRINDLENDDEDIVKKCEKYYDKSGETIKNFSKDYIYYDLYKMEDSHYMVMLITAKDDSYIGYVYMGPSYIKNSVMIQTTEIISERRGEGIATDAYEFLLDTFSHIISDSQLTDDSESLYKKLGKKYKKQILVKDSKSFEQKLLDIDFEDPVAMKPYENRSDVRFVISK